MTGRLIEADRLKDDLRGLYKLAEWDEREIHFSLADIECNIDMEDSVEAIPIEWIRKWINEHECWGWEEAHFTSSVNIMISDWMAEQRKDE